MNDVDELYDNRSDPDARAVLEDWERSRYGRSDVARLGVAISYIHIWHAAAGVDAVDDADAGDDADAADAAADADSADAANAADAADAEAADAAADVKAVTRSLLEEGDMYDGLKVFQVPGSYYAVTMIGWIRRIAGDEWEIVPGARIVKRNGPWTLEGLDDLAVDGPSERYDLSRPKRASENVHRLVIRRPIAANEEAWMDACPKPKGWDK